MIKKKKAPPAKPMKTEKQRVTDAGEEGMIEKRTPPPDLDEFHGTYVESDTGEEYAHQHVPDDPRGHVHHLKNNLHFHAVNSADFKKLFEKK